MTSLIAGAFHGTAAIVGAVAGAPVVVLIFWGAWHVTRKGKD